LLDLILHFWPTILSVLAFLPFATLVGKSAKSILAKYSKEYLAFVASCGPFPLFL